MTDGIRISVEELKRRMDAGEQFTLLDVRNPKAWSEGRTRAHGAIRVALDEAENMISKIPRDKPIVAYCT